MKDGVWGFKGSCDERLLSISQTLFSRFLFSQGIIFSMIYWILLIFTFGVLSIFTAEKPTLNCINETSNQLPKFIDKDNKYGLWPDLISPHSLKYGQTLLGMEQVRVGF